MHNLRGISIPENADEIYTAEYFRQLGIDTADKMITFVREKLNELDEE